MLASEKPGINLIIVQQALIISLNDILNKMPRYRREYRAIAAVNFGATGIIGVAEV